jgi:hypothetical protein
MSFMIINEMEVNINVCEYVYEYPLRVVFQPRK